MSRATRQSVMKRLWGTVLGLLCTHVYCELGVSQMGAWKEYCGGREEKLLIRLSVLLMTNGDVFQVLWLLQWPSPVTVSLFLIRCERGAGGAESPSLDSPGRSQFHVVVQFFHRCEQRAVVSPKSWRSPCQPVLRSFRDKAEWKLKSYDRP